MLVVADSSPLIVLVAIEEIDVLPTLYGQIVIPPAVAAELGNSNRTEKVRAYFSTLPPWLTIERPQSNEIIPTLHDGETEALHLALELHADLLLVDERRAFRVAVARKINAIGTIRVLEQAADSHLLDLAEAFTRIKQTDFWISHTLLDRRLEEHLKRRQP